MIFKLIIDIFIEVFSAIFNLISDRVSSDVDFLSEFPVFLESILGICSQSINFLYFIFGDVLFIILPVLSFLILEKFVLVPLISFIRSLFIRGFGSRLALLISLNVDQEF